MPRVGLGRAVTVLLLVAVLSTAALVHLIWEQSASRGVEKIVASLEQQDAASVRKDLSATLAVIASTAEVVRSLMFQGAIEPEDDQKRELLFMSLLREQPAIGWIGFGMPDGRFLGSHRLPGDRVENVEIGNAEPGQPRPFRRDVYLQVPGDDQFEERVKSETAYVPLGAEWYRRGKDQRETLWTVIDYLPKGFEPSIVVSKRVELYGKYRGVVMVTVSLNRLSETLSALDMEGSGKAFVLDSNDMVLATSRSSDGVMAAHLRDFPKSDRLAATVSEAISKMGSSGFRTALDAGPIGTVFVSSSELPFENWRLLTAVPRSVFAEEIDRSSRRVLYVIAGMAVLAALTSVLFARMLFARPLQRLAGQLDTVEHFKLDEVRYQPTFLAELNDFSQALKRMAGGLSAFAKYMPLDVVRPLVDGGLTPRPGGRLIEVTVLFADLPGFTELTERLGPDVEPHLTRFLTLAVSAIHAEGGTVDKFIGDAVMAIWNAPSSVPDHAERACRAAVAIRDAMHALPAIEGQQADIRVRIGINTGTALVGNVGSTERLSYTAIGDTVNLASRLVGIAKEQGVEIVASDMTIAHAGDRIASRPLGVANVRGKAVPVAIHALI